MTYGSEKGQSKGPYGIIPGIDRSRAPLLTTRPLSRDPLRSTNRLSHEAVGIYQCLSHKVVFPILVWK